MLLAPGLLPSTSNSQQNLLHGTLSLATLHAGTLSRPRHNQACSVHGQLRTRHALALARSKEGHNAWPVAVVLTFIPRAVAVAARITVRHQSPCAGRRRTSDLALSQHSPSRSTWATTGGCFVAVAWAPEGGSFDQQLMRSSQQRCQALHTSFITACLLPCCKWCIAMSALLLVWISKLFWMLCLPFVLHCCGRILGCPGSSLSSIS